MGNVGRYTIHGSLHGSYGEDVSPIQNIDIPAMLVYWRVVP